MTGRGLQLLARSAVLVLAGVSAHIAILALLQGLPGRIAPETSWWSTAVVSTGLLVAAIGNLGALAHRRRWRWMAPALVALLVLLLTVVETRIAVLGVGPGWDDLTHLGGLSALLPSIRPLLGPALAALGAGCVLACGATWWVERWSPVATPGALAAAILLLATGTALGQASGHPLATMAFGGWHGEEHWLQLPQQLTPEDASLVFSQLALPRPVWPSDAPLCGGESAPPAPVTADRSAIVLVLEGLGSEVLERQREGTHVTPTLRALAQQNPTLRRVQAAGTKTSVGLIAVLTGVPAVPGLRLLPMEPQPAFERIPENWVRVGCATAVVLAADPLWENTGQFLSKIGVQHVIGRQLGDRVAPVGWGVDDPELLRRAQAWADEQRSRPEGRYVLVVNTVGTHHPFYLPPGVPRAFHGTDADNDEDELFRYLDTALGEFLRWYDSTERARGTLLFITGDHVSHLTNARQALRGQGPEFALPLIAINLAPEEQARLSRYQDVDTAQIDVAPTLSHALGSSLPRCSLGIDLLAAGPPVRGRLIVSSDPELQMVVLHCNGRRLFARYREDALTALQDSTPAGLDPCVWTGTSFLGHYVQLLRSVAQLRAFAPPGSNPISKPPPRRWTPGPMVIASHRGATDGPPPAEEENRSSRVALVREAGFDWVELDVSISGDGVPVVYHDATVPIDGVERPIDGLDLASLRAAKPQLETLEEFLSRIDLPQLLIELKPTRSSHAAFNLVHRVAMLVRDKGRFRRVIVDSFSPLLVESAASIPGWEVAWDTPFAQPVSDAILDQAVALGADWVYVHHQVLTAELLERAHQRGLNVMVYPVDAPFELKGTRPDGLITDYAQMLRVAADEALPAPR